ncbi:MAG: hypothetical protein LBJ70_01645, partial [Holosporales bacterium]|nr:hypothetical protein [Holosporales bacterium]
MLTHSQEQGELQRTDRPLDLAVDGGGLLLVKDKSGALGGTRTGTFQLTKEGLIQDAQGLTLQGWSLPLEGAGSTSSSNGTVGVSFASVPSSPPLSAAFAGSLGDLEDIQLLTVPKAAPTPVADNPFPYGTGLSIQKEADGLYSLHGSVTYADGCVGYIDIPYPFVDSLGQDRARNG